MRKIILLLAIILGSAAAAITASAQDIITTRRGEEIQAKVLEVSPSKVTYKRASNPDGPTYSIYASDILIIRYENGDKDIFDDSLSYGYTASPYQPIASDGLRYRDYRKLYNPRMYIRQYSDPYSPAWSGIASAVIPGFGQAICEEWGRGTCFFLGSIALEVLAVTTSEGNYYGYDYLDFDSDLYNLEVSPAGLFGLAGVALYIWSICDAVRVAKVKNMHYQDLLNRQSSGLDIKLEPFLASTPSPSAPGFTSAAGLSLKVSF